jgi:hypothetical protein
MHSLQVTQHSLVIYSRMSFAGMGNCIWKMDCTEQYVLHYKVARHFMHELSITQVLKVFQLHELGEENL